MLYHISLHSFYGWIIFPCMDILHLFIHSSDIWIVSTFWLLWKMLLWTFVRVLHPIPCVCVFFPTPSSNSTPAGYPIIQFNSDTIYLEIPSDSTGQGLGPTRLPLTTSDQSQAQVVTCASDYRLKLQTTPSFSSINLLEWFAELKEAFSLLDDRLIIKEHSSGTARWKRHGGQAMGEGQRRPCPLLVCHASQTSTCSPTWKLSKPSHLGFLWRLHYIGMIV